MSEARANEVDAAAAVIRHAMAKVETLNRTREEAISTNGIVTVLTDVIQRIETLGGDEAG